MTTPATPPTCAPTAAELQSDSVVQQALEQAWLDSDPGDPAYRHEEGGWIYLDTTTGRLRLSGLSEGLSLQSTSANRRPWPGPSSLASSTRTRSRPPRAGSRGRVLTTSARMRCTVFPT